WNKLKLGDEELSDDQLLNRVASYINANATGAGATVSMVKSQNSGDYYVQFTGHDASAVEISSSYLSPRSLGDNEKLNDALSSGGNTLITQPGQNAVFTINGISYTDQSNNI